MEFKDQLNRVIHLEKIPQRIISLVPSLTELLAYFDMDTEVVGITKFCIKPEQWLREKTIIGGTKHIHLDKIRELKPDLIIANKEENTKEIIESLENEFPVYISDIYTLEDTYQTIRDLASMLAKEEYAQRLIETTKSQFAQFKNSPKFQDLIGKRFLYFCWHKPDMIAAKNTYIDHVLNQVGMINASHGTRYPECTANEKPHYVFLSSEPFPFQEKHFPHFQAKYPNAKIILVDGEIFSWYGSRIQHIIPYIEQLNLN